MQSLLAKRRNTPKIEDLVPEDRRNRGFNEPPESPAASGACCSTTAGVGLPRRSWCASSWPPADGDPGSVDATSSAAAAPLDRCCLRLLVIPAVKSLLRPDILNKHRRRHSSRLAGVFATTRCRSCMCWTRSVRPDRYRCAGSSTLRACRGRQH